MSSYGVFADYYDALTLNVDYEKRALYIVNTLNLHCNYSEFI